MSHPASKDIWHLHEVDWFGELTHEERGQLQSASAKRQYDAGEIVFTPVPNPDNVYMLEDGLVRIYRLSESGHETTLGYVKRGEVFGELAVLGDYPRESFAQAVSESQVWKIPRKLFQPFVSSRPALVLGISKQIGERLKRIESRVENLVFRDVHSRVILILLELAEGFGIVREDGSVEIDAPITQTDLATLVGATRQSVNPCIGELAEQGLLRREGRRTVLLKPDELRRIVRPGGA